MTDADLWREFNSARAAMRPHDRALLAGYGIALGNMVLMIGTTRVRIDSGLYEPAEDGAEHFVTPVMIEDPLSPESTSPAQTIRFGELVDLVAWRPTRPSSWALRTGSAEWLGACPPQHMEPAPLPIRRSPCAWFQAGCVGLVLLSVNRRDRYRVLSGLATITAEDQLHAAELRGLSRPLPMPRIDVVARSARHAA